MTALRRRLRIAADKESASTVTDVLTGTTPTYFRGNDIDLEVGFFSSGSLIDASLISSVTLEVKSLSASGGAPEPSAAALMSDTLTTSDLDNTVDSDSWNDGSKEHAVFAFTAAESNIDDGDRWLVISVTTTDAETITWLAGILVVREDGAGLITDPDEIDNYLNLATADARYVKKTDAATAYPQVRADITGLTGGTSTDLDGIVTAALSVPALYFLGVTPGASVPSKWWMLQSGTDAEDAAAGIVRPDDYAASTNEKVWIAQ